MQIDRYIAKGQLVPLTFYQDAVAASQTNAQLSVNENAATGISLVQGYTMPFDGEVMAIAADLDTAGAAGVFTVGASIDGTEDADTTITMGTATGVSLAVARGLAGFVAGDVIGVEITTDGSWDGTASDLLVTVYVLLELEGI